MLMHTPRTNCCMAATFHTHKLICINACTYPPARSIYYSVLSLDHGQRLATTYIMYMCVLSAKNCRYFCCVDAYVMPLLPALIPYVAVLVTSKRENKILTILEWSFLLPERNIGLVSARLAGEYGRKGG